MNEKNIVTTDTILNYIEEKVKQKLPIPPHTWLEASQKLLALMGGEQEYLFELQQEVGKEKLSQIEAGKSVAAAEVVLEASDTYKKFCKQKAKIERIYEFIKIAKIQSRLANEEFRSGNVY